MTDTEVDVSFFLCKLDFFKPARRAPSVSRNSFKVLNSSSCLKVTHPASEKKMLGINSDLYLHMDTVLFGNIPNDIRSGMFVWKILGFHAKHVFSRITFL